MANLRCPLCGSEAYKVSVYGAFGESELDALSCRSCGRGTFFRYQWEQAAKVANEEREP